MSTAFRILFSGSRTWTDFDLVERHIIDLYVENPTLVCIHGDCPDGLDAMVQAICEHYTFPFEGHPADWTLGKRAGFVRNAYMVSLGADQCLAYIDRCDRVNCPKGAQLHGSHGATMCADLAEKAGIETFRIRSYRDTLDA